MGPFNFIFVNKDGLLNNPEAYVFLTHNFRRIILSHVGIAMDFILIKCPIIRYY